MALDLLGCKPQQPKQQELVLDQLLAGGKSNLRGVVSGMNTQPQSQPWRDHPRAQIPWNLCISTDLSKPQ